MNASFSRFSNAEQLESLQKAISFISPSLRLQDFTLEGGANGTLPRVKAVTLRVPEKGNKLVVANLLNIGFRRLRRESKKAQSWDPFSAYQYFIILKKDL